VFVFIEREYTARSLVFSHRQSHGSVRFLRILYQYYIDDMAIWICILYAKYMQDMKVARNVTIPTATVVKVTIVLT
jgi:hypothetical protein